MEQTGDWDSAWQFWFERYARGMPLIGIWLERNYCGTGRCGDVLEIACGSARESLYLLPRARRVVGIDASSVVIEKLNAVGHPTHFEARVGDAFHTGFADAEFDLTFHKGFWILFESDNAILDLLTEQLRVTRCTALALVHNAANLKMRREFADKAKSDPLLYSVRFFAPHELRRIACQALERLNLTGRIRILKQGGVALPFMRGRSPAAHRRVEWLRSMVYRFMPWSKVQNVVLEIEVDRSPCPMPPV